MPPVLKNTKEALNKVSPDNNVTVGMSNESSNIALNKALTSFQSIENIVSQNIDEINNTLEKEGKKSDKTTEVLEKIQEVKGFNLEDGIMVNNIDGQDLIRIVDLLRDIKSLLSGIMGSDFSSFDFNEELGNSFKDFNNSVDDLNNTQKVVKNEFSEVSESVINNVESDISIPDTTSDMSNLERLSEEQVEELKRQNSILNNLSVKEGEVIDLTQDQYRVIDSQSDKLQSINSNLPDQLSFNKEQQTLSNIESNLEISPLDRDTDRIGRRGRRGRRSSMDDFDDEGDDIRYRGIRGRIRGAEESYGQPIYETALAGLGLGAFDEFFDLSEKLSESAFFSKKFLRAKDKTKPKKKKRGLIRNLFKKDKSLEDRPKASQKQIDLTGETININSEEFDSAFGTGGQAAKSGSLLDYSKRTYEALEDLTGFLPTLSRITSVFRNVGSVKGFLQGKVKDKTTNNREKTKVKHLELHTNYLERIADNSDKERQHILLLENLPKINESLEDQQSQLERQSEALKKISTSLPTDLERSEVEANADRLADVIEDMSSRSSEPVVVRAMDSRDVSRSEGGVAEEVVESFTGGFFDNIVQGLALLIPSSVAGLFKKTKLGKIFGSIGGLLKGGAGAARSGGGKALSLTGRLKVLLMPIEKGFEALGKVKFASIAAGLMALSKAPFKLLSGGFKGLTKYISAGGFIGALGKAGTKLPGALGIGLSGLQGTGIFARLGAIGALGAAGIGGAANMSDLTERTFGDSGTRGQRLSALVGGFVPRIIENTFSLVDPTGMVLNLENIFGQTREEMEEGVTRGLSILPSLLKDFFTRGDVFRNFFKNTINQIRDITLNILLKPIDFILNTLGSILSWIPGLSRFSESLDLDVDSVKKSILGAYSSIDSKMVGFVSNTVSSVTDQIDDIANFDKKSTTLASVNLEDKLASQINTSFENLVESERNRRKREDEALNTQRQLPANFASATRQIIVDTPDRSMTLNEPLLNLVNMDAVG